MLNLPCPANQTCSRGANYQADETVNFSVAGQTGLFILTTNTGATVISSSISGSTGSFVITTAGNHVFTYNNTGSTSITSIAATCTGASSGKITDIIKHQVTNYLSAIMGLYGEHRSPLLYHNRSKDDVFQDGSGVIPAVTLTDNSFTLNGSLRGLQTYARNKATTPTPDISDPNPNYGIYGSREDTLITPTVTHPLTDLQLC